MNTDWCARRLRLPATARQAGGFMSSTGCCPWPSLPYWRSEEHTSELQSLMRNSYAVFCLKKKKYRNITCIHISTNKSYANIYNLDYYTYVSTHSIYHYTA